MESTGLRDFIKYNVLTTTEVAELLQISKPRVTKLVDEGDLKPVKKSAQGMLFIRADIDAYKRRKHLAINETVMKLFEPLFDNSHNTSNSIKFFYENRSKLDEIVSIFIYFDELDAVLDNFYIVSDAEKYGELKYVETPYFVLRDINGREMWLSGCNCGYGGTGPGGTRTILRELKDEGTLDLTYEEIDNYRLYRKVKLIKEEDGKWDRNLPPSPFDVPKIHDSRASLYSFRNNLVLIQNPDNLWNVSPVAVLERYRAFIPNPSEIMIFPTKDLAREQGYISFKNYGMKRECIYQIIISDYSGRQIWLDTPLNIEKPVLKQMNVNNILSYCGFTTNEQALKEDNAGLDENILQRIFSWLGTNLRSIPVEPIYFKKDNS